MQKGISFVGLMDLGTLDALKKPVAAPIISAQPANAQTNSDPSKKVGEKATDTLAAKSPLSTPLDLHPC